MRTATVCFAALLVGVVQGAWSTTPVNVTLYGEALCPDTQTFVLRSLSVAIKEVCCTTRPMPWVPCATCCPSHRPTLPGGRPLYTDLHALGQCKGAARWQV